MYINFCEPQIKSFTCFSRPSHQCHSIKISLHIILFYIFPSFTISLTPNCCVHLIHLMQSSFWPVGLSSEASYHFSFYFQRTRRRIINRCFIAFIQTLAYTKLTQQSALLPDLELLLQTFSLFCTYRIRIIQQQQQKVGTFCAKISFILNFTQI